MTDIVPQEPEACLSLCSRTWVGNSNDCREWGPGGIGK